MSLFSSSSGILSANFWRAIEETASISSFGSTLRFTLTVNKIPLSFCIESRYSFWGIALTFSTNWLGVTMKRSSTRNPESGMASLGSLSFAIFSTKAATAAFKTASLFFSTSLTGKKRKGRTVLSSVARTKPKERDSSRTSKQPREFAKNRAPSASPSHFMALATLPAPVKTESTLGQTTDATIFGDDSSARVVVALKRKQHVDKSAAISAAAFLGNERLKLIRFLL